MSEHITILGAGAIGSAVGKILSDNKHQVEYWDKDESQVPEQKDFSELIPDSSVVFLCMPSWAMREALGEIKTHLKPETILVTLSKGLEEGSEKTVNDVFEEVVPNQPYALMAGPMLSKELNEGKPSCTIVASLDDQVINKIEQLFAGSILGIQGSNDVRGAALSSVLKNVYAIAMGITAGLEWGDNFRGCLVAKSCQEMQKIMEQLGGKPETILTMASLGDFVATGFSPLSNNHQFGREMLEKGQCDQKKEGCVALPSLLNLLDNKIDNYRILTALRQVVMEGANARELFAKLF